MKRLLAFACAVFVAACTTVQTTDPATGKTTTSVQPVVVTKSGLSKLTHSDLQAAASRADKNGFPARAGMWRALDQLLAANEAQANACAKAIAAALPQAGVGQPQFAGVADALEAGAEFVATFQVNPQIKANCEPIPIPTLPGLPVIPK